VRTGKRLNRHDGLTRRSLLGVATGAGLGLAWPIAGCPGVVLAQDGASTPTAETANAETSLPAGIEIVEGGERAPGSPVRGGTLRLVRPGTSVANFNPAAFAQDPQIPLSYLEPLVRPDPVTMRPMPWLARRWEWRDDGLELVLMFRDDGVWHDGAAFTAADAEFAFTVYREDAESAVSGLFALVETVVAESDEELRVRFLERDANWLFNAATLPVFSRGQYGAYWKSQPPIGRTLSGFEWRDSAPLGTGPWQVASWDDESVEFSRFAGWWRGEAWCDALVVGAEAGTRQRLEAWEERQSEIAWPVRTRDLEAMPEAEGALHVVDAASVMFAAFNFANPNQPVGTLWSDLRVRRAASMAIHRERYAQEVFGGFIRWDAAGTVAQPWANDPSLTSEPHNPEAAAILLAEAGWVDYNGDGILEDVNGWPLQPVAIVRDDARPELASVLARVARDLAGVGIDLVVETLSPEAFDVRWITARTYDLVAYAYDQLPGFTDFDLYGSAWDIRVNPAGWNPGGYANPDADAAIEEFLGAVSIERQASALRRLQRAVNDDLFGLWLGFPRDLVLIADGIEGFVPDMAWQTARTWELWQEPSRP
jgi:peptide/nickel transport system substrate-binding protein